MYEANFRLAKFVHRPFVTAPCFGSDVVTFKQIYLEIYLDDAQLAVDMKIYKYNITVVQSDCWRKCNVMYAS